ncbi:MAG: hypothetical protein BRC26_02850, partial [Nanohaloarchaea archaeon QH_8_44_6]
AEVYDFAIEDDFYYEKGNVAGLDYEVMALGDNMDVYGPEIADQYKENVIDYIAPGSDTYDLDSLDSTY